jgi:hypothetical protein
LTVSFSYSALRVSSIPGAAHTSKNGEPCMVAINLVGEGLNDALNPS